MTNVQISLTEQLLLEKFDAHDATLSYIELVRLEFKGLVRFSLPGNEQWTLTELGERALWLMKERVWLTLSVEEEA